MITRVCRQKYLPLVSSSLPQGGSVAVHIFLSFLWPFAYQGIRVIRVGKASSVSRIIRDIKVELTLSFHLGRPIS